MEDKTPYIFLTLFVVLVVSLSIWNDKQVEKKGGKTQYIWEKEK